MNFQASLGWAAFFGTTSSHIETQLSGSVSGNWGIGGGLPDQTGVNRGNFGRGPERGKNEGDLSLAKARTEAGRVSSQKRPGAAKEV